MITRIDPTLTLVRPDGSTETVALSSVPAAGCAAIRRWLDTQLKPDPDNPSGPPISRYADRAGATDSEIILNLFQEILLGKVAEFVQLCPSEEVKAAERAVRDAIAALDDAKQREAGLGKKATGRSATR